MKFELNQMVYMFHQYNNTIKLQWGPLKRTQLIIDDNDKEVVTYSLSDSSKFTENEVCETIDEVLEKCRKILIEGSRT